MSLALWMVAHPALLLLSLWWGPTLPALAGIVHLGFAKKHETNGLIVNNSSI